MIGLGVTANAYSFASRVDVPLCVRPSERRFHEEQARQRARASES